jgi:HK97 gp10 family phage protein
MAKRPGRRTGVTGDVELIAAMRSIGMSVQGNEIDRIARASLAPMKDETAANAKRLRQASTKNGQHLDQSVVIAKKVSKGRAYREFWLSFKGRGARIAHLVEFGTAPHDQPKRGIRHPGARPKPFARPAFESTKEETGEIFGRGVWDRIQLAVRSNIK